MEDGKTTFISAPVEVWVVLKFPKVEGKRRKIARCLLSDAVVTTDITSDIDASLEYGDPPEPDIMITAKGRVLNRKVL